MKILQIIYESFGSPFGFGGAGVRAYEIYKRLKDSVLQGPEAKQLLQRLQERR